MSGPCLLDRRKDLLPIPRHKLQIASPCGRDNYGDVKDDDPGAHSKDVSDGDTQPTSLTVEIHGVRLEDEPRGGDQQMPSTSHTPQ